MSLWGWRGNGPPIKIENIEKVRAAWCDSNSQSSSSAASLAASPSSVPRGRGSLALHGLHGPAQSMGHVHTSDFAHWLHLSKLCW